MAKFNPETQASTGGNFINYSQGLPADRRLASLFKNVGEGIQAFMQDRSDTDARNLTQDVQTGVDRISLDAIGGEIPDPSLFSVTPPAPKTGIAAREPADPIPPEVERAANQMSRLKSSFEQGNMREIAYQTEIAKMSKQLRSKYPQWTDKIDDLISNATGTNTANKLRKLYETAFESEQAGLSENEKRKYQLLKETKQYTSDPDALSVYQQITGKKFNEFDFNEFAWMRATGVMEMERGRKNERKADLELAAAEEKNVERKAKVIALDEAKSVRDKLLRITMVSGDKQASGFQFAKMDELIRNGLQDNVLSTEERQSINQYMPQLRVTLEAEANRVVDQYTQYLPNKADQDQVREIILQPLNTIEDALTNENLGILNALKRDTEARTLSRNNAVLDVEGGIGPYIETAKKVWGPEAVEIAFRKLSAGEPMQPEDQAITNKVFAMFASGLSLSEVMKSVEQTSLDNPDKTVLNPFAAQLSILADPSIPEDKAVTAAKKLFSPREEGVIRDYAKANPEKLFDLFTSVWGRFEKTEVKDDIYRWSLKQAVPVLQPLANQIVSAQKFTDTIEITYDPKSKRFITGDSFGQRAKSALNFEGYKLRQTNEAVSKMNRYLDKLEPMIAANGDDLDLVLSGIFTDREWKNIEKEGSFFTRMKDSFFENMKNPPEGKGGGETKPTPLPDLPTKPKGFQEGSLSSERVNVKEAYGPGRPGRPNEGIRQLATIAAGETGMSDIVFTSGKGNKISASGKRRGQKTTQHSTGNALDVAGFSSDEEKFKFIENAVANGANGIGIYDNGSIHIDSGKERQWNWGSQLYNDELLAAIKRGKMRRRSMASAQ